MSDVPYPAAWGTIVGMRGKLFQIELDDGRRVDGRIDRAMGCMFGGLVGWRVRVEFRKKKAGSLPLVVKIEQPPMTEDL